MSSIADESDADHHHQLFSDELQDAQLDVVVPVYRPEEDTGPISSEDDSQPETIGGSPEADGTLMQPRVRSSPQDGARVIPNLTTNPYAHEPTYFTRPNRYFGPDSTWLSWTREERFVAETLDQLRSQDLSIHLFNAYALKRAGQASAEQGNRRRKGKARARSSSEGNDSGGERQAFVPHRTWTAWPLPPDVVPRESDDLDDGDGTYKKNEDPRPSAVLEDCLVSTGLRLARDRWESRDWEPEIDRPDTMKAEDDSDVEMATEKTPTQETKSKAGSIPSSPLTEAADTLTSDSDSGSEVFVSQRWNVDEQNLAVETVLPASDVKRRRKSVSSTPDPEVDHRPTPTADDEEARSLLLPGTRHLLSKVDDLLMGLHTAREAYATTTRRLRASKNARGSETDQSDSASINTPSQKRKRSVSVVLGTSDHSTTSANTPTRRARRTQLNPRDWSDVVGMAALTGWPAAVVERASARCASLFGENMLFRIFSENYGASATTSEIAPPHYEEHYAVTPPSLSQPSSPIRQTSTSRQHQPQQPPKAKAKAKATIPTTLIRTSSACTTCQTLKKVCVRSSPGTGPCQRCTNRGTSTSCSGITSKLTTTTTRSTRCPHPSCDRHYAPFQHAGHLQRHLDTVHLHDSAEQSLSSAAAARGEFPANWLGNANAEVVVCPVPTCPRNERPFGRAARLYTHVSKKHPEIEVDEVKRWERMRKGDTRGRARGVWALGRRVRDGAGRWRSRSGSGGRGSASESQSESRRADGNADGLREGQGGGGDSVSDDYEETVDEESESD